MPRTANSFQLGHNTLFEAAFAVPRMSIVVSYEQQPPRRPPYASTAQKHPKLEMPQDMKHYEALLAITQALGMRHPKPRSLQPHPEMRQGFSLLISLSDDQWDSDAGLDIKILAWKQRPAESGRGRLSHGVCYFQIPDASSNFTRRIFTSL